MKKTVDFFSKMLEHIGQNLNVCMIGQIQSYDDNDNTATIVPLHQDSNGEDFPPIDSVPLGFFSLGGFTIKVSPKVGDSVLLLYCDYDIDNILTDGKTKKADSDRTHSLEDAIAIPLSVNFLNNAYNNSEDLTISKTGTTAYIKMKSNGDIIINSNNIKLGENATKAIKLADDSTTSKVKAE